MDETADTIGESSVSKTLDAELAPHGNVRWTCAYSEGTAPAALTPPPVSAVSVAGDVDLIIHTPSHATARPSGMPVGDSSARNPIRWSPFQYSAPHVECRPR